jgi:hypothetical protein
VALSKAAEKVQELQPGPKCGFGAILKALGPDDLAYYRQMLAEGKTRSYIAEVFRADGHNVSGQKISRHLRGQCACP